MTTDLWTSAQGVPVAAFIAGYVATKARLKRLRPPPAKPSRVRPYRPSRIVLGPVSPPVPDKWPAQPAPAPYDHCGGSSMRVPLTWREILTEVCQKHQIRLEAIMGLTRKREVVRARHEVFYRLREEQQLTFAHIGEVLGGFDHTTVRHGCALHARRLEAGD